MTMSTLAASPAWLALEAHSKLFKRADFHCEELFSQGNRFQEYSLRHDNLLLDYSKNFCNPETLKLLMDLAKQAGVTEGIAAMFAGEHINNSEDRAALHTALRAPADSNPNPEVVATLNRMTDFVNAIHNGDWRGCTGEKITDVVNIGIGGSDLGPAMVTEALQNFSNKQIRTHFISNVDPANLNKIVAQLNPATSLFIIASKSFNTLETHENANGARAWFLAAGHQEADISKHFIAITTNLHAAKKFGMSGDNLFPMWDWVGGRFSLWSAIGLSIALSIGMKNFRQLLAGAHSMDLHFQTTELDENIPVIMALLTVWYTGFFNAHSTAVVPYSHELRQLPQFLQQLYMESLGKRVSRQGLPLETNTGEVIWGTEGSNGQHSYFQLLHQGTEFIPVDFLACAKSSVDGAESQHTQLLANCLSQSLGLLIGKHDAEHPEKDSPGNRPSNTLLLSELSPYNLGALLALYEHKVYAQSIIWNINAFDQWGVELGKELSKSMNSAFTDQTSLESLDSSSAGLLGQIMEWNRKSKSGN